MVRNRAGLTLIFWIGAALFLNGCGDSAQSPPSRTEPPARETPQGSGLEPIDLVYICGNKFLATNSTGSAVNVTYRVVGTDESGSLTLSEGPEEDPGFSETELQTSRRGVVELYQDDQRVARRRNQGLPCGAAPSFASVVASAAPSSAGQWGASFAWPVIGVHQSLLPTGKVLSWGEGTPQLWNPSTGTFTAVAAPVWLFCAGHSVLSDGRLLVSGGHITNGHGLAANTIFNPSTESWSQSAPMRRGRWYPTNTTLGTGEVVILAGRDEDGLPVDEPEVWSSGAVRTLTGASLRLQLYPRTFLAPNGKLFYAGEGQMSRYLDPTGAGSWTNVGNRLYGIRDYGAAVMYEPGKILYVGGGHTTNTAEIIDLNSASPAWQWTGSMAVPRRNLNATVLPTGKVLVTGGSSGTAFNDITQAVRQAELWSPTPAPGSWTTLASSTVSRAYHSTSILLPDGRVLHSGSGDAASAPNEFNADVFSPPYLFQGPRPTITDAPSLVAYGTSFTVTTPDAADIAKVSLIRLGSTTHAFDMNQRFQWLSFTRTTGALSIAMPTSRNRTPPGHYMLFILDGNDVPSVAKIVKVGTDSDPEPPPTSSIVLSVTTRTDATKQYMTLQWTGASGTTVDVHRNGPFLTNTPNDGYYTNSKNFTGQATYVYKVCQVGTSVCSNEATAQFGGPPPPSNVPPTANFTFTCSNLTCNFTDASADSDGSVATWLWDFGDETSSSLQNPSHTYEAAGTYTVSLSVADNDEADGATTKQVQVPVAQSPIALTVTGRTDATKQYMTLRWTGASSTTVDVHRNGPFLTNTPNDGVYTNSRNFTGSASYTYKVCEVGTTICSNPATVTFGTAPPPNMAPNANFTSSCSGLTCDFTDTSTDDVGVTSRSWDFGDNNGTSTLPAPSYTFPAEGSYDVTLTATDAGDLSGTITKTITVALPPPNAAPTANFTVNCTGFTCNFTDTSTDDSGVTLWAWDFGDQTGTSSAQNPSYTYAGAESYDVTLTATDAGTLSGTVTHTVTVTPAPAITLTVTGRTEAGKQYMTLRWTGPSGATVDVYRNGPFLTNTLNDGVYTNSRNFTQPTSYTYKVCQVGTAICSNEATVVFN